MHNVSTQSLMIAISSVVMERCRLEDLIAVVSPEVDEDEHLSEQVMDMDMALGELSGSYEEQIKVDRMFPSYDALVEKVKKHYDLSKALVAREG